MYPTHRTLYCDHCGKESDPRSERHTYEEPEILPGDCEGGDHRLNDFVRLHEHRKKTGDEWWCMECWIELTTPEISSHWKDECLLGPGCRRDFGHFQFDDGKTLYIYQTFGLRRCSECGQWLQVPNSCPVVETNRYTTLLGEAGNKIDGWYFGVLFKKGNPVDILCPEHFDRKQKMKRQRQEHLRASLAKLEERTRKAS